MKLKYRGVSYGDNSPRIAQEDVKVTGKYRGGEINFHDRALPIPQPVRNLVYRGVADQTGTATQLNTGEASIANRANSAQTASSIQERSRRLMMKHHRAIERRELSMLSRLASEIGLCTDASHYRNRIQGEFPYGFAATYDRSQVAMS